MAIIAICIPFFNEEENLPELYRRLCNVLDGFDDGYSFSMVFVDNCSNDISPELIKEIARLDSRVGYIRNASNFGFVRSSAYALLTPNADANIFLMSDLQDPPELIPDLIKQWRSTDSSVVFAVRSSSQEDQFLFTFKKIYYWALSRLSDYPMVRDSTGFGIYDKAVINALRRSVDSYPFIKGLVCAIGFKWSTLSYKSANRSSGRSSASISFLVDFGVLGIITSSRKPMRIMTISGVCVGAASIFLSLMVLITKLLFWNTFQFGLAMLSTSMLLFTGIVLLSVGILGEYIGFINQRGMRFPLVVEAERHNVP